MAAELDGLVANGVMRGRQHTYALVAERVPDPVRLDPDAALAELTRRYLTSHGPATVQDFAWWSSLTVAQIRRGLDLAGASLVPSEVDGGVYWSAPPGPARPDPAPTAQVLQGYDEYVIGYAGSRRLTNLAGLPVRVPDATGLHHPLVLDSQQVGSWRRSVDSGRIVARLTLATELTTAQRGAVEAAFARYADFAGVPVVLDWPARG